MSDGRPVALPRLAAYLVSLRDLKGWKQAQAADIAKRRKLAPITYGALRWLEEGKNQSPEPDLLRAVAVLYDTPYETLIARLLDERYGAQVSASDLRCHTKDQRSGSQGDHVDVPASTRRIGELESELAALKTRFREVQDVANNLFTIAVRSKEGRSIARDPASRRRTS